MLYRRLNIETPAAKYTKQHRYSCDVAAQDVTQKARLPQQAVANTTDRR